MESILTVEIKNQFGRDAIHPINSIAQTFALIAGTKTLTKQHIKYIKTLGYTVQVVSDAPTEL